MAEEFVQDPFACELDLTELLETNGKRNPCDVISGELTREQPRASGELPEVRNSGSPGVSHVAEDAVSLLGDTVTSRGVSNAVTVSETHEENLKSDDVRNTNAACCDLLKSNTDSLSIKTSSTDTLGNTSDTLGNTPLAFNAMTVSGKHNKENTEDISGEDEIRYVVHEEENTRTESKQGHPELFLAESGPKVRKPFYSSSKNSGNYQKQIDTTEAALDESISNENAVSTAERPSCRQERQFCIINSYSQTLERILLEPQEDTISTSKSVNNQSDGSQTERSPFNVPDSVMESLAEEVRERCVLHGDSLLNVVDRKNNDRNWTEMWTVGYEESQMTSSDDHQFDEVLRPASHGHDGHSSKPSFNQTPREIKPREQKSRTCDPSPSLAARWHRLSRSSIQDGYSFCSKALSTSSKFNAGASKQKFPVYSAHTCSRQLTQVTNCSSLSKTSDESKPWGSTCEQSTESGKIFKDATLCDLITQDSPTHTGPNGLIVLSKSVSVEIDGPTHSQSFSSHSGPEGGQESQININSGSNTFTHGLVFMEENSAQLNDAHQVTLDSDIPQKTFNLEPFVNNSQTFDSSSQNVAHSHQPTNIRAFALSDIVTPFSNVYGTIETKQRMQVYRNKPGLDGSLDQTHLPADHCKSATAITCGNFPYHARFYRIPENQGEYQRQNGTKKTTASPILGSSCSLGGVFVNPSCISRKATTNGDVNADHSLNRWIPSIEVESSEENKEQTEGGNQCHFVAFLHNSAPSQHHPVNFKLHQHDELMHQGYSHLQLQNDHHHVGESNVAKQKVCKELQYPSYKASSEGHYMPLLPAERNVSKEEEIKEWLHNTRKCSATPMPNDLSPIAEPLETPHGLLAEREWHMILDHPSNIVGLFDGKPVDISPQQTRKQTITKRKNARNGLPKGPAQKDKRKCIKASKVCSGTSMIVKSPDFSGSTSDDKVYLSVDHHDVTSKCQRHGNDEEKNAHISGKLFCSESETIERIAGKQLPMYKQSLSQYVDDQDHKGEVLPVNEGIKTQSHHEPYLPGFQISCGKSSIIKGQCQCSSEETKNSNYGHGSGIIKKSANAGILCTRTGFIVPSDSKNRKSAEIQKDRSHCPESWEYCNNGDVKFLQTAAHPSFVREKINKSPFIGIYEDLISQPKEVKVLCSSESQDREYTFKGRPTCLPNEPVTSNKQTASSGTSSHEKKVHHLKSKDSATILEICKTESVHKGKCKMRTSASKQELNPDRQAAENRCAIISCKEKRHKLSDGDRQVLQNTSVNSQSTSVQQSQDQNFQSSLIPTKNMGRTMQGLKIITSKTQDDSHGVGLARDYQIMPSAFNSGPKQSWRGSQELFSIYNQSVDTPSSQGTLENPRPCSVPAILQSAGQSRLLDPLPQPEGSQCLLTTTSSLATTVMSELPRLSPLSLPMTESASQVSGTHLKNVSHGIQHQVCPNVHGATVVTAVHRSSGMGCDNVPTKCSSSTEYNLRQHLMQHLHQQQQVQVHNQVQQMQKQVAVNHGHIKYQQHFLHPHTHKINFQDSFGTTGHSSFRREQIPNFLLGTKSHLTGTKVHNISDQYSLSQSHTSIRPLKETTKHMQGHDPEGNVASISKDSCQMQTLASSSPYNNRSEAWLSQQKLLGTEHKSDHELRVSCSSPKEMSVSMAQNVEREESCQEQNSKHDMSVNKEEEEDLKTFTGSPHLDHKVLTFDDLL